MVINHGGNLTVEYFLSYFTLILNSRQCTVDEAKEVVIEHFFDGKEKRFGEQTYQNFSEAYNQLKVNETG